jgi:hypothetical protein
MKMHVAPSHVSKLNVLQSRVGDIGKMLVNEDIPKATKCYLWEKHL